MSSDSTPLVNFGGRGNILPTKSDYVIRKELRKGAELLTKEEFLSDAAGNLFTLSLLDEFPFLEKFKSEEGLFRIPANTLNTNQIRGMLDYLRVLGLFYMGPDTKTVHQRIQELIIDNPDLEFQSNMDSVKLDPLLSELELILLSLREFLVVEYFTSMNEPQVEAIIHNRAFEVSQHPEGCKVSIDIENWAGEESLEDNSVEGFEHRNLDDVIDTVDELESPEEKGDLIYNTLVNLRPVAQALDFMVAPTRQVLTSEEGNTVTEEVEKYRIAHFDVKPANIFLSKIAGSLNTRKRNSYVLGDFGLAVLVNKPIGYSVMGTPFFRSPELLTMEFTSELDRSDVYSFAVTLYCLIFSTLPNTFINIKDGSHTREDAFKFYYYDNETHSFEYQDSDLILSYELHRLLVQRGITTEDNTDAILNILARGMSLRREYRYPTCTEMLDDLLSELRKLNL